MAPSFLFRLRALRGRLPFGGRVRSAVQPRPVSFQAAGDASRLGITGPLPACDRPARSGLDRAHPGKVRDGPDHQHDEHRRGQQLLSNCKQKVGQKTAASTRATSIAPTASARQAEAGAQSSSPPSTTSDEYPGIEQRSSIVRIVSAPSAAGRSVEYR